MDSPSVAHKFSFRYEPANRQTTADFLVSVTDPNGRIPRDGFTSIPKTASEFAERFKNSPLGAANKADMESYRLEFVGKPKRASEYIESARAEHAKGAPKKRQGLLSGDEIFTN